MLLRPLVLLLLLLNAAWFGWAHGYLRLWGLGPAQQSEPQRLERQLRPELLRIEPRAALSSTTPAPPAPARDPQEAPR